jgi:hypothetical protein
VLGAPTLEVRAVADSEVAVGEPFLLDQFDDPETTVWLRKIICFLKA